MSTSYFKILVGILHGTVLLIRLRLLTSFPNLFSCTGFRKMSLLRSHLNIFQTGNLLWVFSIQN